MRTSRRVLSPFNAKSFGSHAEERRTSVGAPSRLPLTTERAPASRLSRAWRAVRGTSEAVASELCGASGWHLSSGCIDGDGATICPLCGQRVTTVRRARVPRGVGVLEEHGAT